ncbi:MAG: helix-turn-helix transcriptional regulator [Patescibacteria group bacterium]|jgi:transcriptional regulator with XRE-family HTH domain
MRHDDLKNELLKDQKFSKEYFKNDPSFKIGRQIKEMRISKGLTQEELAKRMGKKQSSIARIESGRGGNQTDGFLKKFADALGVEFNPSSFSEIKNLDKTTNRFFIVGEISENHLNLSVKSRNISKNVSTISKELIYA